MKIATFFAFSLLLCLVQACKPKPESSMKQESNPLNPEIFVGTYTQKEGHVDGKGKGIYRLTMNSQTGQWSNKKLAYEMTNPSFLYLSADGNFLYAVSELAQQDNQQGEIFVFAVSENKKLNLIQRIPTGGLAPCHINASMDEEYVFVANYLGGVISMYRKGHEGKLELTESRKVTGNGPHANQDSAHPHSVIPSPDDKFLMVPDLGSDKIWIFAIDRENGRLNEHTQAYIQLDPGSGPRHFTFHPNGKFAYLINELDNTVNVLIYDAEKESLNYLQKISTLPADFDGVSYCADIHVHPTGQFVYGSNRGHDSIVVFEVEPRSGLLRVVQHIPTQGGFPRNIGIDPSGMYLYAANQNTDNVVLYRIDLQTGTLIDQSWQMEIETPVCILFAES